MAVQRVGRRAKTLAYMAREGDGHVNKTAAKAAGIACRSCADGVLGLSLSGVETMLCNAVRAYDLERTTCDMVRGRRFPDGWVLDPAMRAYARRRGKSIPKASRLCVRAGRGGQDADLRGGAAVRTENAMRPEARASSHARMAGIQPHRASPGIVPTAPAQSGIPADVAATARSCSDADAPECGLGIHAGQVTFL